MTEHEPVEAVLAEPLLLSMSDNFPLSDGAQRTDRNEGDDLLAGYLQAARAPNTHRAYAFDLVDFEAWGGTIPASAETIARYLASRAPLLRPSTLRRRVAALASLHRDAGHTDPTKAPIIRRIIQGIERKHGSAPRRVRPLLIGDLARIVSIIGPSAVGLRDRALLLTGFFGALRRSELVALEEPDIAATTDGLSVFIRKSKTDGRGEGRKLTLPARDDELCPVIALQAWRLIKPFKRGPLFTTVNQQAASLDQRPEALSAKAVARIVKKHAFLAGLDPETYSGHSLRAGFISSAAAQGFDAIAISMQTRHRTQQALSIYCRAQVPLHLSVPSTVSEQLTAPTART